MAHDITCRKENEIALRNRVGDMERMIEMKTGEEQQVTGLKKEVNELLLKLGEREKYSIPG
jgi:hypothetical protein